MEDKAVEGWEDQFESFLNGNSNLLEPLRNGETRSLCITGTELFEFCEKVLLAILFHPLKTLEKCNSIVSSLIRPSSSSSSSSMIKPIFRISSMPPVLELIRNTVPKNEDLGYFLSFSGTVIKTQNSPPKMLEYVKDFRCMKCGFVESVQADFEQYYKFNKPNICGSCHSSKGFSANNSEGLNGFYCKDYQEIKVQEQVGNLSIGTIPRSIWVVLEDDLVDTCKPGDDVMIIGVVMRRWRTLGRAHDGKTDINLVIKANYCQIKNHQKSNLLLNEETVQEFEDFWKKYKDKPLEGRNVILSSFCPQVYGLFSVKLAAALILAGGVERIDESGTRVRGESHLLMVGDPGTGKSQILKYASKLSPRSVMTTGMGSTTAGLTVSAVRDSGTWNLEAGALVLADGGICCIDEFNAIRESERTCIHEAMEQQSLSIAKAGLVCRLQTRCSILAAANPKGTYDSEQPLSVNIAVASPLLSRFDLVLLLLDSQNERWDEIVSSHLLNGKTTPRTIESHSWSLDKLRSYFIYVKTINPELSPDAVKILGKYYQYQRSLEDYSSSARTTVRLLQSVIRLAQGHARLILHKTVEVIDAVNAVSLMEASNGIRSSLLPSNTVNNPLHSEFPEDPMTEYFERAQTILRGLGLTEEWEREEQRLKREISSSSSFSYVGETNTSQRDEDTIKDKAKMMFSQVMSKLKSNKVSYGPRTKKYVNTESDTDGFDESHDSLSDFEDENLRLRSMELRSNSSDEDGLNENGLDKTDEDDDDEEEEKEKNSTLSPSSLKKKRKRIQTSSSSSSPSKKSKRKDSPDKRRTEDEGNTMDKLRRINNDSLSSHTLSKIHAFAAPCSSQQQQEERVITSSIFSQHEDEELDLEL